MNAFDGDRRRATNCHRMDCARILFHQIANASSAFVLGKSRFNRIRWTVCVAIQSEKKNLRFFIIHTDTLVCAWTKRFMCVHCPNDATSYVKYISSGRTWKRISVPSLLHFREIKKTNKIKCVHVRKSRFYLYRIIKFVLYSIWHFKKEVISFVLNNVHSYT